MTDVLAAALSRRSLLGALPVALSSSGFETLGRPDVPSPRQTLAASGAALSGVYPGHLQGVCTNDRDALYWSMTTELVKTTLSGDILGQVSVPTHHGDLCHVEGRLYVAVNLGLFNDPGMRSDSWVYVYDAEDLSLLARRPIPDVVYGAGGIAFGQDRFIVVGGLADGAGDNRLYAYDSDFTAAEEIRLPGGPTYKGIQTAAFDGDHWWFGCYGRPDFMEVVIRTDRDFGEIQRFAFDASTGLALLDPGVFLVARSACGKDGCVARLAPARLNAFIESGWLRPL